jgi:hypothetical protein
MGLISSDAFSEDKAGHHLAAFSSQYGIGAGEGSAVHHFQTDPPLQAG